MMLHEVELGKNVEFVYNQPFNGDIFRSGVVEEVRDTNKLPVVNENHRRHERGFRRGRFLVTVRQNNGQYRQFYSEQSRVVKVG